MDLGDLFIECAKEIKEHPEKKNEIIDLFQLAESEVEEGGSVEHECELAMDSLKEIIQ